jgi:Tol biopolymer transport system component
MVGERKPFPVVQTGFDEIQGQFSPDGRWVAYASNETGRYEIYIRSFPAAGGQWQISTGGGITPRWRHDGQELFYVAPDNRMMAAPIHVAADGRTVSAGSPVALFASRLTTGNKSRTRLGPYDIVFALGRMDVWARHEAWTRVSQDESCLVAKGLLIRLWGAQGLYEPT